jgi:multiple antibiotic resistance protein
VQIAVRATLIATAILMLFLVGGQYFLEAMDVGLPEFQIAGGLVLFVFGLRMVFEQDKVADDDEQAKDSHSKDVAVFPIALPSIAGPAALMTIVVLTDNHRFSAQHQAVTAGVMLVVLLITAIVLSQAGRIQKLIGDAGINVLSRVMGLILCAVAVQTVVDGLRALLPLA